VRALDPFCILVAEDDSLIRFTTTTMLKRHGYRVLEAQDGAQAIRVEAEYKDKIDVLVTNVHMRELSGHALARKIKAGRPDVKVLIVSTQGEAEFPPDATSHDLALAKPVTFRTIMARVEQLLLTNHAAEPQQQCRCQHYQA
jgi:DNA-binding response OmpR family regulator